MRRRQRLELDELRVAARPVAAVDAGDAVQERAVLPLREAVLQGAGAPVGVVARIGLRDEDAPRRIDGEPVEQGAHGVDDLDEPVGRGVEDVQVAIGDAGMPDDVHVDAERQDVVVVDHVDLGVERAEVAIDLAPAAGDLRLVVGLERDDVETVAADGEGARSWAVMGRIPTIPRLATSITAT